MTLLEIPVGRQGVLKRRGIKRLVKQLRKEFPKLTLIPHPPGQRDDSLFINIPGEMTPTKILKRARVDFQNRLCALHEWSYTGDRETTFYICDNCKYRRKLAWDWIKSNRYDQYEQLSHAIDDLEDAIGEWP